MTRTLALFAAVAATLAATGCIAVSHTGRSDSGWSGENAAPFDASLAECEAAHTLPRDIDACMAAKGWTRK